jgi:RNA polymerase sigma-70 factor (ECF subfamily)
VEIDVDACYQKYGPMVLRRCWRILKDKDKAHDAMQEVFLKLLQNHERLQAIYLSSLLYRMATNVCLNRIRDERKHQTPFNSDFLTQLGSLGALEDSWVLESLFDYILKVEKASTHQIAVLYFVDGLTMEEIAEEMDLSVTAVCKRLQRLRRVLKNQGGRS